MIKLFVILATFVMAGCKGPHVTVYISDPENAGMAYYNENTKASGFVPYAQTDQYICLTPEDAQTVLNFAKIKQK